MLLLSLTLAGIPHHHHQVGSLVERKVKRAGRRCKRGDMEACAELGLLASETGSPDVGYPLVQLACSAGSDLGCINLVVGAAQGLWPLRDEGALIETRILCGEGNASACHALADWTAQTDPTGALDPLGQSCALGDPWDCANHVQVSWEQGQPIDVELLELACEEGVQCGYLGASLVFGWFGEEDLERGLKLSQEACEEGDAAGCSAVAFVVGDADYLKMSCAYGDTWSCELAALTLRDLGRVEEADALELQLCTDGDGVACARLAALTEDKRRRLELAARGCDLGDDFACGIYGRALLEGWGTDAQPRAARPLLEQACEAGNLGSCNSLALLYADGCGVEVDIDRGLDIAGQACEDGFLPSCVNRGEIGWHARGRSDGEPFLRKACDEGRAWGCGTLGYLLLLEGERDEALPLLETGCEGGPDSPWCDVLNAELLDAEPQRIAHLEQSCAQAERFGECTNSDQPWSDMSFRACSILGSMYLEGHHVVRDEVYGQELLSRACEGGDYQGCRALEALQSPVEE